jgi:chromosome segregation ATPase
MLAKDSSYLPSEEANDRIEQITTANQELLEKVNEVGVEVKKAIEKVRQDKLTKRKKRRQAVSKQMYDELSIKSIDIKEKMYQRNKLYSKLQEDRKEIKTLKARLQTLGGVENMNKYKDEYQNLVDENYKLYEEVKTYKKENDRLTKEVESLVDSDPQYDTKLAEMKQAIENEKKRSKELYKEQREVDAELQKKCRNNIKIKEEARKLKEKLSVIRHGKSLALYKQSEHDDYITLTRK